MLNTLPVAKRLCLQLILILSVTIGVMPISSAFAATTYNYFLDGEEFDLTGMFTCASTDVSNCSASDISMWMFEVASPTETFLALSEEDGDTADECCQFEIQLSTSDLQNAEAINADLNFIDYTLASGTMVRTAVLSAPSITAKVVPVPATLPLFLTGLAGLAGYLWRQRRGELAHQG